MRIIIKAPPRKQRVEKPDPDEIVIIIFYNDPHYKYQDGKNLMQKLDELGLAPSSYIKTHYKKRRYYSENINEFLEANWVVEPMSDFSRRHYEIPEGEVIYELPYSIELFRSKAPAYNAEVERRCHFTGEGSFSRIRFTFNRKQSKKSLEKIIALFDYLITYGGAQIGSLQHFTADERNLSFSPYRHGLSEDRMRRSIIHDQKKLWLNDINLRLCLPDLYSITVFGKPYIEMFGRQRILSAPCYKVEELAEDVIRMQLVEDWTKSLNELDEVKDKVKEHVGRNAFYDYDLGIEDPHLVKDVAMFKSSGIEIDYDHRIDNPHKYDVPVFDLSKSIKRLGPNDR